MNMNIAVLGTGVTGQTIGTKLVQLGHEVMLGSRDEANPPAVAWAKDAGQHALYGTFQNAAEFGEIVFNCTLGSASLDALQQAGAENLRDKILIDTSNPLDRPSETWTLTVCNTDSLGEQIQRAFPDARVVKALNTVNGDVMVDPGIVPGSHTLFLAGDDAEAKVQVAELLQSFGWPAQDIIDLGDITAARGTEMYLPLWLRLFGATGTGHLNVHVI